MKIIGTGTIHHLPKGSEHEVTEEIGHILVRSGRAVAKNEVLIGSELIEIELINPTTGEATIIPAEDNSIEGNVVEDDVKNKDAVKEEAVMPLSDISMYIIGNGDIVPKPRKQPKAKKK